MSRNNNDSSLRRMLEDSVAAFLSNRLPAVIVEPLQHVADLHREDNDGCRMRLLYGLQDGAASSGRPTHCLDLIEPRDDLGPTGR
jgi:hypothetical protein